MFTSPDSLIDYIIRTYPSNLPTYWITGNHESKTLDDVGVNIAREVSCARDDMHYLGFDGARININDQEFFLYHGEGGKGVLDHMAYGFRNAQERCKYPIKAVFCGHLHAYKVRDLDGVLTLAIPSFQATTPFMKRPSKIGGVILTLGDDRQTDIDLKCFNPKSNDL